jgi:hypothetical protein
MVDPQSAYVTHVPAGLFVCALDGTVTYKEVDVTSPENLRIQSLAQVPS